MFPYSTLSLVRFWIHAHASVYASFGTALVSGSRLFDAGVLFRRFSGDDFRIHRISALLGLIVASGPDARHPGRYGPDGQLRGEILADMVVDISFMAQRQIPVGPQSFPSGVLTWWSMSRSCRFFVAVCV